MRSHNPEIIASKRILERYKQEIEDIEKSNDPKTKTAYAKDKATAERLLSKIQELIHKTEHAQTAPTADIVADIEGIILDDDYESVIQATEVFLNNIEARKQAIPAPNDINALIKQLIQEKDYEIEEGKEVQTKPYLKVKIAGYAAHNALHELHRLFDFNEADYKRDGIEEGPDQAPPAIRQTGLMKTEIETILNNLCFNLYRLSKRNDQNKNDYYSFVINQIAEKLKAEEQYFRLSEWVQPIYKPEQFEPNKAKEALQQFLKEFKPVYVTKIHELLAKTNSAVSSSMAFIEGKIRLHEWEVEISQIKKKLYYYQTVAGNLQDQNPSAPNEDLHRFLNLTDKYIHTINKIETNVAKIRNSQDNPEVFLYGDLYRQKGDKIKQLSKQPTTVELGKKIRVNCTRLEGEEAGQFKAERLNPNVKHWTDHEIKLPAADNITLRWNILENNKFKLTFPDKTADLVNKQLCLHQLALMPREKAGRISSTTIPNKLILQLGAHFIENSRTLYKPNAVDPGTDMPENAEILRATVDIAQPIVNNPIINISYQTIYDAIYDAYKPDPTNLDEVRQAQFIATALALQLAEAMVMYCDYNKFNNNFSYPNGEDFKILGKTIKLEDKKTLERNYFAANDEQKKQQINLAESLLSRKEKDPNQMGQPKDTTMRNRLISAKTSRLLSIENDRLREIPAPEATDLEAENRTETGNTPRPSNS